MELDTAQALVCINFARTCWHLKLASADTYNYVATVVVSTVNTNIVLDCFDVVAVFEGAKE